MRLHLNFIAVATGIIIFFLLISLAQEVNRQWQVQREIERLQSAVRQQQATTIELEQLNQYFRTDDFRERLAREKLNYRAPGEQVVLIPEPALTGAQEVAAANTEQEKKSLPRRWWDTFFGAEPMYE